MVSVLQRLISAYHWLISPWLGSRCRFAPSCSEYASQALQTHGVIKGSVLATKRLCRCHPWGGEGFDPVPSAIQQKSLAKHQKQHNSK